MAKIVRFVLENCTFRFRDYKEIIFFSLLLLFILIHLWPGKIQGQRK